MSRGSGITVCTVHTVSGPLKRLSYVLWQLLWNRMQSLHPGLDEKPECLELSKRCVGWWKRFARSLRGTIGMRFPDDIPCCRLQNFLLYIKAGSSHRQISVTGQQAHAIWRLLERDCSYRLQRIVWMSVCRKFTLGQRFACLRMSTAVAYMGAKDPKNWTRRTGRKPPGICSTWKITSNVRP